MQKMFDQLGGLGRLVKGKTVAIKFNLTGAPTYRLGYLPLEDTHYTHPHVVAAAAQLMTEAGARRIRVLESPWSSADPVEEYLLRANIEPRDILGAGPVEFENTNYLGSAKKYSRLTVPFGGYVFPAFDLNHSYEDCDVFVSIAKLKEHATAGVTLSMKNCFGMTPATIYGQGAGVDEPSELPNGGRIIVHAGNARAVQERAAGERPEIAAAGYLAGAADGGGPGGRAARSPGHYRRRENHDRRRGSVDSPGYQTGVAPGVLMAGLNPVNTDAVAMSVMGFDPMADRGTPPFERCDSIVKLAEEAGLGTRNLSRIEVIGTPIAEVRFDFAALRKAAQQFAARRRWERGVEMTWRGDTPGGHQTV